MTLDPHDLRAYAARDWGAPARLARAAERHRSGQERVQVAIALYEAAKRTRPDWPTPGDERRDLETLLSLLGKLRSVGRVGTR